MLSGWRLNRVTYIDLQMNDMHFKQESISAVMLEHEIEHKQELIHFVGGTSLLLRRYCQPIESCTDAFFWRPGLRATLTNWVIARLKPKGLYTLVKAETKENFCDFLITGQPLPFIPSFKHAPESGPPRLKQEPPRGSSVTSVTSMSNFSVLISAITVQTRIIPNAGTRKDSSCTTSSAIGLAIRVNLDRDPRRNGPRGADRMRVQRVGRGANGTGRATRQCARGPTPRERSQSPTLCCGQQWDRLSRPTVA
jgi:hypothetical protein